MCSFLWLSNIPLYMYHNFLIYSSVSGHLRCLHVLATVNNAAMNNGIHVSFSILVFSPKNLQTINAEKNVEKREHSCTVGGDVNWYSHCGRRYGGSLKNRNKTEYDPAIPFLGIYPEESKIGTNTCIPLFIAAIFTIAITWSNQGVHRQING